jgi:hypothetical protein
MPLFLSSSSSTWNPISASVNTPISAKEMDKHGAKIKRRIVLGKICI